jgi:alcohol oxidase
MRSTYPIKDDFLRAVESQGIPVVDDLQDLKTGHGAEHWYASFVRVDILENERR